jgi:hypothetical protein
LGKSEDAIKLKGIGGSRRNIGKFYIGKKFSFFSETFKSNLN